MDQFTIIVIVSSIVDGLIMLASVAIMTTIGCASRRLTFGKALSALVLAAPVVLVKAYFLLTMAPVNMFGLMNLVFIDLVIVAPVVAILIVTVSKRRAVRSGHVVLSAPVRVWLALMAIGGPAVGIYAHYVEPNRLQIEHSVINVPAARALAEPIRIGVLADFQTDHIGAHEQRAVEALMAQRPDIIAIPGDVFQGTAEDFENHLPAMRELFSRLRAPGGVYVVYGNCDHPAIFERIFSGLEHITVLRNETVTATVGDVQLLIGGLLDDDTGVAALATVARLENPDDVRTIRILIAHRPDAVELMQFDSRVDLLVAGHTHGGQVCIPFFGPPLTLTDVPRVVAAGGLHELDGRRLYVSRGVGHERGQAPRIRFLCPPEVSVITIR